MSDETLVSAVVDQADRRAFETLVRRYQRPAVATCLAVLRDRQLAEDAAQDASVAAYRNLRSLRDRGAFGGWLISIALNQAIRLARKRERVRVVEKECPPQTAPPSEDDWDEALLEALGKLPDHERVVVMLRHFEGHEVAAIAAITGRPVGTVTKQLSRAHERLRKALAAAEVRR